MVAYPESPRTDVVDLYHGVPVPDPYRWLEDMESAATLAWVDAQNELTFSHMAAIEYREPLQRQIEQLWDFPRQSAPVRRGDWYFFSRNEGLQAQPVLYKQAVGGGEETVILDPNAISADGTVAVMTQSFTDDGSLLAYSLAEAGSDWQTAHVLDTGVKSPPAPLTWPALTIHASWHDIAIITARPARLVRHDFQLPGGSVHVRLQQPV